MLYVKGLYKEFAGRPVVCGISFDVVRGQVLGFLGPNGAGKSTTMRMITGFLRPDAGEIHMCDTNALENPVLAQSYVGYLPEGSPLYGDMTTFEFLQFMGEIRQMSKYAIKQATDWVVSEIMLEDILYRPIDTLSKGYKRRVGLAAALLSDPEILILDEPTDGLDPNQKHHVRQLIKKLAQKKAIIISTHILEEVDSMCTDSVIIHQGHIVSYATPKELLAQSDFHNAVSLIIDTASLDEIGNFFQKHRLIDKIKIAGKMPKWTKMILFPKQKAYILGEIATIVHEKNWKVAELHAEHGKMEEVFRRLTQVA